MTSTELEKLIHTLREVGGDISSIEAKRSHRELPRRIWETLSALANTPGGGVLILGLDESQDFAVAGVGV